MIGISLTVSRESDRTNPKDPITSIESGGDYRLAGLRSLDLPGRLVGKKKRFFFLEHTGAGVRTRGRFKGPDPTEWPRFILGVDRMSSQDDSRLWKPNDDARLDRT